MQINNRHIRTAIVLLPLSITFFLFQNFSVPNVNTSFLSQGAGSFLIQDVCVDANDQPTLDDPYACPYGMQRRNLKVGENLTYQKHDKPDGGNPIGFQNSASLPPLSNLFISTMNMVEGPALAYQAGYANFDPRGFNIAKAGANWYSFVGTKDGSLPYTQGFFNTDCLLQDSWLLFTKDVLILPKGVGASALATVWGAPSCDKTLLPPIQYWPRANTQGLLESAPLTYSSGKTMETITSYHWGLNPDGTADHLEKFYFTDQYGLTRWERWKVGSGTENISPCNGPSKIDNLIRVDCRDWTYVDPLPAPVSVFSQFQMSTLFPDYNLLKDPEFRAVTDAPAAAIGAWKRFSLASTLNWSITDREVDTNRRHIAFSCAGACSTSIINKNALVQDYMVQGLEASSHIQFGGTFWAESSSAPATLALIQFGADGVTALNTMTIPMTLNSKKQIFSQRVNLVSGATKVRFAIYPSTANVVYRFRDGHMSSVGGVVPLKFSLTYSRGFQMTSGQTVSTTTKKLDFKNDGDICVSSLAKGNLLWCANSGGHACAGSSCKLEFRQDGNLCAYKQTSSSPLVWATAALWCSGTVNTGNSLVLQNVAPYLRITNSFNIKIWPQ